MYRALQNIITVCLNDYDNYLRSQNLQTKMRIWLVFYNKLIKRALKLILVPPKQWLTIHVVTWKYQNIYTKYSSLQKCNQYLCSINSLFMISHEKHTSIKIFCTQRLTDQQITL